MKKKETMSIRERKARIESLTKELESLQDDIIDIAEERINGLIRDLESELEWYTKRSRVVGKESEQATRDGELLFEVDGKWRNYTQAEIDMLDDVTPDMVKPYYNDIWVTDIITVDDMYPWEVNKYKANLMVIDLLKELI